jgi:hypothetical protein
MKMPSYLLSSLSQIPFSGLSRGAHACNAGVQDPAEMSAAKCEGLGTEAKLF